MMGTGASFKSKEEAIAAGKTEAEIAEYIKNNPSLITPVAAPAAAAATAMATTKKQVKAVVRRTVPNDHSCLYTSFGSCTCIFH